jgi:hypothetical protein
VTVAVETASGQITVKDGISQRLTGGPVAGKLAMNSADRMAIRWSVRAVDDRSQHARLDYTLTHFKDGRPATLRMKPFGYGNDFVGKGDCKVKAG